MSVQLFAQPYDLTATGFYFEDFETYQTKAAQARNSFGMHVEEFEIQFIDGDIIDAQLFAAWRVCPSDINAFFDAADEWNTHQKTAAIIALREGMSEFTPSTDNPDNLDIDIYHVENLEELAEQFVEEGLFGEIPENLLFYIDYSAIARDLSMGYTMTTIAGARIAYRTC